MARIANLVTEGFQRGFLRLGYFFHGFWKIDVFGPSLGIARLPSELLLFLSGAAGVGKFWAHSKPILLCENVLENIDISLF